MSPIDHVTIRVHDLAASALFFTRCFRLLDFPGEHYKSAELHEWHDFSIAAARPDKPPTHGLQVAFAARTRAQVEAWWRALVDPGHPDAGQPGARRDNGADCFGASIRDPAGNLFEAIHRPDTPISREHGVIDHLQIRVRDLRASTRFYTAAAAACDLTLTKHPDRLQIGDVPPTITILQGEPTKNLHLAFGVDTRATVNDFFHAGLTAGGGDNGEPGERSHYHHGYYSAYLLDPDSNNIEAVCHRDQVA
jgi:catechol 2,3-dioxygenase-like lactoylglutathione lyase family enzyme